MFDGVGGAFAYVLAVQELMVFISATFDLLGYGPRLYH
jgi:hypothetical protein